MKLLISSTIALLITLLSLENNNVILDYEQDPCSRTDLIWFSVSASVTTSSLAVAEANIDNSIPSVTGNLNTALTESGCANTSSNYCWLGYLPSDVDATTKLPKPGRHPVCTIKRIN